MSASYLGLCTATSSPVSIVERLPFSIVNSSSDPSCNDDIDGIINVSVTGATPFLDNDQLSDYNFSWFPSSLNNLGT